MAGLIDARVKTEINKNEYDILPHPATEGVTLAFKIAALLDAINAESERAKFGGSGRRMKIRAY